MRKTNKRMKQLVTALLTGAMLVGCFGGSITAYAAGEEEMRAQAEEDYNNGYYYLANEKYPTETEKMRAMTSAGQQWYVQKYYLNLKAQGRVGRYETALYANALRDCERYEEALKMYDSAVNDYTDNEQMLSYIMDNRDDCLQKMERFAEGKDADAVNSVSEYLTGDSNEEIANNLYDAGFYEEALTYYQKAESEDGLDERKYIADTLYSLGRDEEALAIFEELHAEAPEDVSVLNRLGGIYCDAFGRYADARDAFEKGIELNPNANVLMSNLGIVAYKSGDFEGSAEQYRKIAEAYPDYTDVFFSYLAAKKDISVQECKDFLKNMDGWPQDDEMQALMLLSEVSVGSLSKTSLESWLEYFDGIVQSYPGNYYFLREKALLLKELERYDEAAAVMEEAIEVAGMMEKYGMNTLAGIYERAGRYDEAVTVKMQVYEMFGAKSYDSSVLNYYLKSGDYEAAKTELERYDSLDGTYSDFFHMAIGYLTGDYETVLKYADICLEDDATDIKSKAYKAVALQELGMDGADALIAEIDSRIYPATDVDKMIVDCILNRLESAKAIYRNLLVAAPGTAADERDDYELINLFYDAEFCELAGRELLVREAEVVEGTLEAEESTETENTTEDEEVIKIEETEIPVIPIAGGVVAILAVAGVAVALAKKRK